MVTTTHIPRSNAHPLAWPGVVHWEKVFAVGLHLTILLIHFALPVLPCLVLWLWRRKRSRFIDDHGRQALNFQITLLTYSGALLLLSAATCGAPAFVLIPVVYVLGAVGTTLACVAANRGRVFRYPMCIPFFESVV